MKHIRPDGTVSWTTRFGDFHREDAPAIIMGDDGRTAWGKEGGMVSTLSTVAASTGNFADLGIRYVLTSAPGRFSRIRNILEIVAQHQREKSWFRHGDAVSHLVYPKSTS